MSLIYLSAFIICILICWCLSVPDLNPRVIASCQVGFKYLKIVLQAIRKHLPRLIRRYNEHWQKKSPQDRTTQTPDCGRCARLLYELTELQEKQQRNDFDTCMQSVMHERHADLEASLNEAEAELKRRERFLRVAEAQANQQRTEMHSLKEELRLARDDNNSADFRKSLAVQQDLERLRQQNAQLTAANLRQVEHTLRQKNRTLKAERELDIWADKIKTLVDDRNGLRQRLDEVHAKLRHQERRAGEQREGRIRAEVENEELRRPRTTFRREREAMFT
ncbi:hypothetical protein F5B21DRAFT_520564 [Xylaria acuta]|nr:hypothetical protein F5B21DRAFT_520564 [Xylaria acuta]